MDAQKDPEDNTDHCGLFPYQREGIDAILGFLKAQAGYRAALLADPRGAGKSAQAIVAFKRLGAEKVLVVCPKSLKLNWAREIAMWTGDYYPATVLPLKGNELPELPEGPAVVVINYHQAVKAPYQEWLCSQQWDCLVFDESHQLRSPTAHQSRVLLILLWAQARYRICITGTPVPNGRAYEAWTVFSRMAPDLFGESKKYLDRYCIEDDTPWGTKYPRSRNLEELGRLARERFMVRRPLQEVLGQLPPLVRQVIPLDIPKLQVFEAEQAFREESGVSLDELMRSIEAGVPLSSDPISTARRKLGVLKVGSALEFIQEELESVESIVVFAHHREVFFGLLEGLKAAEVSVVSISGQTKAEDRQKAVDDFQAGLARVAVLSIMAAGTGITLTRSATTVFVECSWAPADNNQAEGRTNRIGQTEVTRALYLVVPDSLDEHVVRAVTRKARNISKLLQEEPEGLTVSNR